MSNLKPNAAFDSIASIDYDFLKNNNIKGILLDIDNTLIDKSKVLEDKIINWIINAKNNGFLFYILTNTSNKDKVIKVAEALDIPFINFARKPSKKGFIKAAQLLNLPFKSIAMVGDQVFTDVIGANRVGMFSIYVKPINKNEYFYTAWKRPLERLVLKHYGYEF